MLNGMKMSNSNRMIVKYCVYDLQFTFHFRMNRLKSLGRGFGACPSLEVLDITHNKLSEEGLPGNFWMMGKSYSVTNILEVVDETY